MATNRKRTPRGRKAIEPLSPALLHYFHYGSRNKSLCGYEESVWITLCEKDRLHAIWREHGAGIVADWQKKHPGEVMFYEERYETF